MRNIYVVIGKGQIKSFVSIWKVHFLRVGIQYYTKSYVQLAQSNGCEEANFTLGNGNRNVHFAKLMSIDKYANHSIELSCSRVNEFLVLAEMCTIVMSSAQQSPWCCGKVAPHSVKILCRICTSVYKRGFWRLHGVTLSTWRTGTNTLISPGSR